ncbi:hypothetical protein V5799_024350 [Amblyomma americanum]|uniref:Uncharacterized protein n=1 Tax=Amblyomma americanum TaxID=6943 RepID=A0AAQ4EC98_AMBAM
MRLSIVLVGALATFMALTAESIYGLWYLSSDLVYVILFPQLVCVVYLKEHVNTYGSFAAYVVGCVLRAGGGESILNIPPFIEYPFFDREQKLQLFPFRTFAMAVSFLTLLSVSGGATWLFTTGRVSLDWDLFRCFQPQPEEKSPLVLGADMKATPPQPAATASASVPDSGPALVPAPAAAPASRPPPARAAAPDEATPSSEPTPSPAPPKAQEDTAAEKMSTSAYSAMHT